MKTALLMLWGVLVKAATNLLGMFVSWTFVKWALKLLTKKTTNQIDDNIVELVDAAYMNDTDKVKKYAEAVLSSIQAK